MGVVEVEVGRLVQRQNDSFAHSIDVALIADHDVLDSVELVVVSGASTGQQRGSAATDGDGVDADDDNSTDNQVEVINERERGFRLTYTLTPC